MPYKGETNAKGEPHGKVSAADTLPGVAMLAHGSVSLSLDLPVSLSLLSCAPPHRHLPHFHAYAWRQRWVPSTVAVLSFRARGRGLMDRGTTANTAMARSTARWVGKPAAMPSNRFVHLACARYGSALPHWPRDGQVDSAWH